MISPYLRFVGDFYFAEQISPLLLFIFHEKFYFLWHKENKPHGFEVHDLRIGGRIMRLKTCQTRIHAYPNGEPDDIPELNEEILDWFGGNTNIPKDKYATRNNWRFIASAGII